MERINFRLWMLLAALGALGCETRVQQGLDERQANEVLSALLERGFEARKRMDGGKKLAWAIHVDSSQAKDATRVLVELGLPRERQPSGAELYKPGLVPTPSEELQARVLGLQGDLSRTLESVDGVLAARVHLAVPAPPKAGQTAQQAKAAAFLRVQSGRGEEIRQQADQLKALIAGSVESLSASEVTLVVNEAVPSVLAPSERSPVETRLRAAVAALGVLLVLMSSLLWVSVRGRPGIWPAALARWRSGVGKG